MRDTHFSSGHCSEKLLKQRQAYPLDLKIGLSLNRIRHWYDRYAGRVYVAFSGGKDSTVLLHLVRSICPEIPAVFVDTGLEYPEIRDFVRETANVTWLRPRMTFKQVIEKKGWPVVSKVVARAVCRIRSPGSSEASKHKTLYGDARGSYGKLPNRWRFLLDAPFHISDRCCEVMKINPILEWFRTEGRAGFVGTMAADSNSRRKQYLTKGCYLSDLRVPRCTPMAFWTDIDVWDYIEQFDVPYCPIYDGGVRHTGCMFCAFGVVNEGSPNRFQLMQRSHPQIWRYCMDTLGMREVLDYLGVPCEMSEADAPPPCRRCDHHALGQNGAAAGRLGPGLFDQDAHGISAVEPMGTASPSQDGNQ